MHSNQSHSNAYSILVMRDEPDRSRYRTSGRMASMWRQHEYFALIVANVSDLSLVDSLQDYVAFTPI